MGQNEPDKYWQSTTQIVFDIDWTKVQLYKINTLHSQKRIKFLRCWSKNWTTTNEQLPMIDEQRGLTYLHLAQIGNAYLRPLFNSNYWRSRHKAIIVLNNYTNIQNNAIVPQCVDNPTNFTGLNMKYSSIENECF